MTNSYLWGCVRGVRVRLPEMLADDTSVRLILDRQSNFGPIRRPFSATMNSSQTLCKQGCGFYGSPSTEGMCSVCFRNRKVQEAAPDTPAAVATPPQQAPVEPRRQRCSRCKSRVDASRGTGFECSHCHSTYCCLHACHADYKTAGRAELAKNNPRVVADKIANRIQ